MLCFDIDSSSALIKRFADDTTLSVQQIFAFAIQFSRYKLMMISLKRFTACRYPVFKD